MKASTGTSQSRKGSSVLLERRTSELSVAFVNNMPDSAFMATEKQFINLITSGSGSSPVNVSKYSMAGISRGKCVGRAIAQEYIPIEAIWGSHPDALVITGSEPLAARLSEEAYWGELACLIHTFVGRTGSVLLSCLSAHAAIQLLDSVIRTPLSSKCTGVFAQKIVGNHPMTDGIEEPLLLPHSRLNEITTSSVKRAGYEVLVGSRQHGWSVASKSVSDTELLLFQGHPEYSASSLLREYRRDVERFITGQREEPPPLPADCVAAADSTALLALHRRILNGDRDAGLLESFGFDQAASRAGWPWRRAAVRLFTNWLTLVRQQKS